MPKFDYSTIDLEALRKLPVYRVPWGHHASKRVGNACFLDAPGFPTYFTRSAWDARGGYSKKGPKLFITDPENGKRHYVVDGVDLRTLWKPIPYSHDTEGQNTRLILWMQKVYAYGLKTGTDPVAAIREFYPEHTEVEDWITSLVEDDGSDWWERYDRYYPMPSQQNWMK